MSGAIHQSAARGFALAPADYERGRPMYPFEAARRLVKELRITPESTVLDLAAGTGKLTRLLAQLGCEVVAVEPVDEMRERLMETLPGVTALEGTAEEIPLDDESVDFGVMMAAMATCSHAGQGCAILSRLAVPRDKFDGAVEMAKGMMEGLNVGDPSDPSNYLGPLINAKQREKVQGMVDRAISIRPV